MKKRMTGRQKKFLLKLISLYINKKYKKDDGLYWKDYKGNQYENVNYKKSEYNDSIYDCMATIVGRPCESVNKKMAEFTRSYFRTYDDKFYFFETKEPVNYDKEKKKWYLNNESKFYKKIIKGKISKSSASRLIFWLKKIIV